MQIDAKQELANTISHAIGVLIGLIFLPLIIQKTWNEHASVHIMAVVLYSFCFILLFLSSTLYHAARKLHLKKQLKKLDHIAIYFMIAGSYTPFIFSCLNESLAWLFFTVMWLMVMMGTIFKLFFINRFEKFSLILYLFMGWMVIFIIKPFVNQFDSTIILLVCLGGLSYTGGVFFYANDSKKFYHLIWHIFVLLGGLFHLWAIFLI